MSSLPITPFHADLLMELWHLLFMVVQHRNILAFKTWHLLNRKVPFAFQIIAHPSSFISFLALNFVKSSHNHPSSFLWLVPCQTLCLPLLSVWFLCAFEVGWDISRLEKFQRLFCASLKGLTWAILSRKIEQSPSCARHLCSSAKLWGSQTLHI